jgi:hypothetical protein
MSAGVKIIIIIIIKQFLMQHMSFMEVKNHSRSAENNSHENGQVSSRNVEYKKVAGYHNIL